MSNTQRKYHALDVVKLYSTLSKKQWLVLLQNARRRGNVEQLTSWRYGMQAGLADAAKKGLNSDNIDLFVIRRCREIERTMRLILKEKYPNPLDNPRYAQADYINNTIRAKKLRDRDFEEFLKKSAF